MSALPLPETERRAAALGDAFFEAIGRQAQPLSPSTMSEEQRTAAISSTASFLRALDALLDRVRGVEDNSQPVEEQAARVRDRLTGLRAAGLAVMAALNPDQVWFWTEEWQAKEREADTDEARGRMTFHATTEDFLTALQTRTHSANA